MTEHFDKKFSIKFLRTHTRYGGKFSSKNGNYIYFLSLCYQLFPRHRMEISSMTEMVCYLYLEAFCSISILIGVFSVIFSGGKDLNALSLTFPLACCAIYLFLCFVFPTPLLKCGTVATTERFIVLWTV